MEESEAPRFAPAISSDRGENTPAESAPATSQTLAAMEVDADRATDSSPIRLPIGKVLRIHLRASPASGYGWSLEGAPPTFLHIEADPGFEAMWPAGPHFGAGTMNTWDFRAQGHGRGLLRFAYRRPWDSSAAPARVTTFDVVAY